jgi:ribosomal protein S12 methylthiotransferase accessory factor YcaO
VCDGNNKVIFNALGLLFARYSISNDIEECSKQKKITISKINLPLELGRWISAYQIDGKTERGLNASGLGADFDPSLALIKAYVEFVERSVYVDEGEAYGFSSTNGIAGHRFASLAKKSAISEIYERDSFLLHWYSATPMELVKIPAHLTELLEKFTLINYSCLFFKSYLGVIPTYSCFLINKTTGGFVVGLSSGKTFVNDIQKALTEAIINLFFGNYGKCDKDLIENVTTGGIKSLEGHRAYWLLISHFPAWMMTKPHAPQRNSSIIPPGRPIRVFIKKVKKVSIVGYKVLNSLEIGLGPANALEIQILKSRFNYDISSTLMRLGERPHPIP